MGKKNKQPDVTLPPVGAKIRATLKTDYVSVEIVGYVYRHEGSAVWLQGEPVTNSGSLYIDCAEYTVEVVEEAMKPNQLVAAVLTHFNRIEPANCMANTAYHIKSAKEAFLALDRHLLAGGELPRAWSMATYPAEES